jgi:hypothetical protein
MSSWKVTLESGHNVQRSAEVYLGDLATSDGPLQLTVNNTASEFYVNDKQRLQRLEGTHGSTCCTAATAGAVDVERAPFT